MTNIITDLTKLKLEYDNNNVLDGITLYESINVNELDKLINSNLLKIVTNTTKPLNEWSKKRHSYDNEKKYLEAYRDLVVNSQVKVTYKKSESIKYGRSNVVKSMSLYSMRRAIRHTIQRGYVDIDIDNAHPTMLCQIMKANKIACTNLESYINNREKWYDLIAESYNLKNNKQVLENPQMKKEICKLCFIRLLYGGSLWEWKKDYDIDDCKTPQQLNDFIKEVNDHSLKITENNPELYNIVRNEKLRLNVIDEDNNYVQSKEDILQNKKKSKFNLYGSVSSHYLQEIEVQLLQIIYVYLTQNNYIIQNNCVLCSDGIMIKSELYKKNSNLLTELSDLILKCTNLKLSFSQKPMNMGYSDILDKHLNFNLYTETFSSGLLSSYFKIIYNNKFLYNNGNLYEYNDIFWVKNCDKRYSSLNNFIDIKFTKHLINYITNCIYQQNKIISNIGDDDEAQLKIELNKLSSMNIFSLNINKLRGSKKRNEIVQDVLSKLTNEMVEWDSDPLIFTFKNKILNLKDNKWIKPHYDQYITINTGYDYNDYEPSTLKDELYILLRKIIPDEKVLEYFLCISSNSLCGIQLQKFIFLNGNGGNGKSVISSLLLHMLGNYSYVLPSISITKEISDSCCPALSKMNKMRMVLCSEPSRNSQINSGCVKAITGSQRINARDLYSSNCTVNLEQVLYCECNHIPIFDEVSEAVKRRIDIITFNSRFLIKEEYDTYTEQERQSNNIYMQESYYCSDDFKLKYKQTMFQILREHFIIYRENNYKLIAKPTICLKYEREYLVSSDEIMSWFESYYSKDETNDSIVYVNELYELFSNSSYYENMTKINKRNYNKAKFNLMLRENMYIKQILREARSYHNKKRETKAFIVGYTRIQEEDSKITFENC